MMTVVIHIILPNMTFMVTTCVLRFFLFVIMLIIFPNYLAQRLQLEFQQHMQQSSRSAPPSPVNTLVGCGIGTPLDFVRSRRRDRWRGRFRIRKLSGCKQS